MTIINALIGGGIGGGIGFVVGFIVCGWIEQFRSRNDIHLREE